MKYLDFREAKSVFKDDRNVMEFLRKKSNEDSNTSEIIEIAYDLQAGSYIKHVTAALEKTKLYADELHSLLTPHLTDGCSILDVGTGELTTLSLLANKLDDRVSKIFAFDISWSRLSKGLGFWNRTVTKQHINLSAFVADIKKIPLAAKSIDVVTSNHALEPNGKNLASLLSELFRVCKRKCVLFEPSYEHNSREGKKRMDSLGYIKGLEETVKVLGGTLIDFELVKNTDNPLNPTACYVIDPPLEEVSEALNENKFSVPGTSFPLILNNGFMESAETGLLFPVLNNIPILKEDSAILASSLFD
ncbi:class I SAM-dependent methyltransferase [Gammaproteobacteria bacterium]|nr:class I SAM-dependent methyltransferase [Gammaproteobacteria bacterium]